MPIFEKIFARDPANPDQIASNATITLFDPADPNKTPIAITRVNGQPLENPYTVNRQGEGPAFMHPTLFVVGWEGGGFSHVFVATEEMHAAAIAARTAAENSALLAQDAQEAVVSAASTAGVEAAAAAQADLEARIAAGQFEGPAGPVSNLTVGTVETVAGSPLDAAVVADQISTPGTLANTALTATYARNGVYENFTEENFRKVRAAIAAQYAGQAPARISVLGDSNSNGFQQPDGADYRRSYGYRAQQVLDGVFGPSKTGIVYSRIGHSGAFARADNRMTVGAGWVQLNSTTYGPAGSGAMQGVGPTAGTLDYAADVDCNAFDVWFRTSTDAPTSVSLTLNGQPAPDVTIAADTFAGDGALTTTETGGLAWQTLNPEGGTWSREAGQLKATKLGNATRMYALVDTGHADGRLSIKRSANIFDGMVFRQSDLSNYWAVAQNGSSQYLLVKLVGGATTIVATSTLAAVAGDAVSVELAGSSIAVKVNGVQAPNLTATDSFNVNATKHGYRLSNGGGNALFDDFSFIKPSGGGSVNLNGAEGIKKVSVPAETLGKHTLNIDVISTGSAVVLAVEAYDSTKTGLRWTLAGYSGGKATEWNRVGSATSGNAAMTFTVGDPDLIVVNLMINAHNANQTIADYKAEMGTFIDACKAVADVILVASPPAGNGSTTTWVEYLNAQRELAAEKGCGLINMQDRWGPYSLTNAEPFKYWADPDHPSNKGYWDMGLALAEGVKLAVGRSA